MSNKNIRIAAHQSNLYKGNDDDFEEFVNASSNYEKCKSCGGPVKNAGPDSVFLLKNKYYNDDVINLIDQLAHEGYCKKCILKNISFLI